MSGLCSRPQIIFLERTRFDPKAVEAVKAEVQALADLGTWDESSVTSRADLIEWAQKNKIKIVVGDGRQGYPQDAPYDAIHAGCGC